MKKSLILLFSITGLFIADCDYGTDSNDEHMDKITIRFLDAETRAPLREVYASLTTRATNKVYKYYNSVSDSLGYCAFTVDGTESTMSMRAEKSGYNSYEIGSGNFAITIPSIIYMTKN
jgi:hypothetical protein